MISQRSSNKTTIITVIIAVIGIIGLLVLLLNLKQNSPYFNRTAGAPESKDLNNKGNDKDITTQVISPEISPNTPYNTPRPVSKKLEGTKPLIVGQVTGTGGIDDRSFNENVWRGIARSMREYNVEGRVINSKSPSEFKPNIETLIKGGADSIVSTGYLLSPDTLTAARQYPNVRFIGIEFDNQLLQSPSTSSNENQNQNQNPNTNPNNLQRIFFTSDEAAFLAGYVAAGMTKTGKVATYGGYKIPPVITLMDGFANGVNYYNKVHPDSKPVQIIGWNPETKDGIFVSTFENLNKGIEATTNLVNQGADIILPVAGAVGLGSAAYCFLSRSSASPLEEPGEAKSFFNPEYKCQVIGVDTDWVLLVPEYRDVILTSILKGLDLATYNSINDILNNKFSGGLKIYNLANKGVSLAPDYNGRFPRKLQNELSTVRSDLISGKIKSS